MPSTTFIYALRDPRDGRICYVGKSDHPKFRGSGIRARSNSKKK